MSSDRWQIEVDADAASEAIRSINHQTIFTGDGIPAPVIYRVLGNLQSAAGHGLSQALRQLAAGLERSLATHDVYEDDGRDPRQSVANAVAALTEAAGLAGQIGPMLESAQAEIARQGYHTTGTDLAMESRNAHDCV